MLKVVKVARNAVKTGDFSILKTNLEVLNEYLKNTEIEIEPDDFNEIVATIRNIKYMIEKEKDRRKEIASVSNSYDAKKESIAKCDELFDFYSNILNEPIAHSYTYSPTPASFEEGILKEFFDSIQKELGLSEAPKSLVDIKAEMAKLEKSLDEDAFKINKLNGVYDEKVAKEDLQRAAELAKEEKDLNDKRKDRINLRKDLQSKVPADEYKKYTGKNKIKEIDTKISEIEKIPQNKRTQQQKELLKLLQQLKPLSTIKKLDADKKQELDSIYTKYGVTSIEEMKSVLSNHEVENAKDPTLENPSRLITSDLVERTEDSHVSTKEGIRVIKKLNANSIGKTLEEATMDLRQNGYMPCVGKDSAIYARPVIKRPIFGRFGKPKLVGMELVEESIESLTKSPEDAYAKALKELKERSEMLENGPIITNKEIAKMKKAFSELIKDSRYDEAIKRIIAAQTSMTRTDLANFAMQHSKTHDSAGKDTTVKFPGGDENYKAPHIPVKTKFFGLARIPQKPDLNTPNEAVVAQKDTKYLKDANIYSPSKAVVSKNVLRDRTHYKDTSKEDEHDEI